MNVPIVEDYAGIAKRLAELHPTSQRVFRLPTDIRIFLPATYYRVSSCRFCFVLDEKKYRLYHAPEASQFALASPEGMAFFDYFMRYFPSVRIINSYEWQLSPDDCRRLGQYVREQQ